MLSTLKAPSLRHHIIPQTWNLGYKVYASRNSKSSFSQGRPHNKYDLALVSKCIRQWREQAAMALKNRSHILVEATGIAFSRLGSQLNRLSGYEEIEAHKKKVIDQGTCEFPQFMQFPDDIIILCRSKNGRDSPSRSAGKSCV
jgi:hypothetical protein